MELFHMYPVGIFMPKEQSVKGGRLAALPLGLYR